MGIEATGDWWQGWVTARSQGFEQCCVLSFKHGYGTIRFVFEKHRFVEKGQVRRANAALRGEVIEDNKEEGSFDRFGSRGLTEYTMVRVILGNWIHGDMLTYQAWEIGGGKQIWFHSGGNNRLNSDMLNLTCQCPSSRGLLMLV